MHNTKSNKHAKIPIINEGMEGQDPSPSKENPLPNLKMQGQRGATPMEISRHPSCFRFTAALLLTILSVYGVVGVTLNTYDLSTEISHGLWPFNPRPMKTAFACAQGFLLVTSLLGWAATFKRDRNFYFWSVLLFLCATVLVSVLGVCTLRARSQTEIMADKLLASLEAGNRIDFDWINGKIQSEHRCCGIRGPVDWVIINRKLEAEGKSFGLNETTSVPDSCCQRSEIDKGIPPPKDCGRNAVYDHAQIYTKGCESVLIPLVRKILWSLGVEMLIVAAYCIFTLLFLYSGAAEIFCFATSISQGANESHPFAGVTAEGGDDNGDSQQSCGHRSVSLSTGSGTTRSNIQSRGTLNSNPNARANQLLPSKSRSRRKEKINQGGHQGSGGRNGQEKDPNANFSKGKLKAGKSQQNKHHGNVQKRSPHPTAQSQIVLNTCNLEMLYEGVDVNISKLSTMSTTPNPSGSMFYPWPRSPGYNHSSDDPSPPRSSKTNTGNNQNIKGVPLPSQVSRYSSVPHFPPLAKDVPLHSMSPEFQKELLLLRHSLVASQTSGQSEGPQDQGPLEGSPVTETINLSQLTLDISTSPQPSPSPIWQASTENESVAHSSSCSNVKGEDDDDDNPTSSLNIPEVDGAGAPIQVEVTTALTLIAEEDAQAQVDEALQESGITICVNADSNGVSEGAPVTVPSPQEKCITASQSSLGFESSHSRSSVSSSSSAEENEQRSESVGDENIGDVDGGEDEDGNPLAGHKSKMRFPTLPTIVEEPEPGSNQSPLAEGSPTESTHVINSSVDPDKVTADDRVNVNVIKT